MKAFLFLLLALAPAPEIEREVQRIAGSRALWPGFEPLGIPLAVYDGQRTWLFRHPAGAQVLEGRHPAVNSNTSAEIGGTRAAALAAGVRSAERRARRRRAPPYALPPQLGNDSGKIEAIDGQDADLEALTEGVGPHPLFNGVRRAAIAGLGKPEIKSEGGTVEIRAPGFSLRLEKARVEVRGTEAVVKMNG